MVKKYIRIKDAFTATGVLVLCVFILACSDSNHLQIQDWSRSEFIKTYAFVTENQSVEKDLSDHFEYMEKVNSDAFNSIAYRWHHHALDTCQLSVDNKGQVKLTGYEKMLATKKESRTSLQVIRDVDRKCLAQVYIKHWNQINKMLVLNYPNTG